MVQASYLYSNAGGFYFMDQESFETLTLSGEMAADALDFIVEGSIIQLHKYNGNPIGLQLPAHVELNVTYTEPGARGDTASGSVTKPAKLETGIEIRVPSSSKRAKQSRYPQRRGSSRGGPDLTLIAHGSGWQPDGFPVPPPGIEAPQSPECPNRTEIGVYESNGRRLPGHH